MHDVGETHDTLFSWLLWGPAVGLWTIVQVLPFHDSINGRRTPDPKMEYPTAVHEVAETHDTPRNWLVGLPALGLVEIDHAGVAPAAFVFTARPTSTSKVAARSRGVAALLP